MLALLNFWQNKFAHRYPNRFLKQVNVIDLGLNKLIGLKYFEVLRLRIQSKVKVWGLLALVSFFVTHPLHAAVDLNKGDVDYSEVARVRGYPGGNQEEDLKVQEVLVEPVQTVYKSNVDEEIIKEFQKQRGSTTDSSKYKGNN